MTNQKASTGIFIDKYHPKADGKCAISIRITYDRKKRYYSLPISLTLSDFEKAQGAKPRNEFKEIALRLQAYEKKAADAIDQLISFSWESFEKMYLRNTASNSSVIQAFSNYIGELTNEGRVGTAYSYKNAQQSLKSFDEKITFSDVTPDFLKRYEKWMLTNGKSITTIGIYLRSLRTIFNIAISEGYIDSTNYPFGRRKYEIATSNNIKKALSLADISAIYYHQTDIGTTSDMAKDYWLFMYLCNGINVKDMCLLKYENIKDDMLEFERSKTARTKRNIEPIRIALTDDTKRIIKKWGNTLKNKNTYIFPVLTEGLTAERERQLVQQLTQVINSHMKALSKTLGIDRNITTYFARHSFATILQRSGVSTEFISEALGHSNVKTTQNYLAGFEDDSKKEVAKALTAFKTITQ